MCVQLPTYTRNKWFCYSNKVRDNKYFFFVAATKNFAVATKRFVDRTKHFVVVTKYFCYPYFNKWFCWYNETFYAVQFKKAVRIQINEDKGSIYLPGNAFIYYSELILNLKKNRA